MTVVSSAHARDLLGHSMDAYALNQQQTHLLANHTPEIDCVLDHLGVLVRDHGVSITAVAELFTLTRRVLESNLAEGEHEHGLCGALDDLAAKLHDHEKNTGAQALFTVKTLGEQLRWALPIVCQPEGRSAVDVVRAGATVDRILREVPAAQLFTESVRKELRDTNYRRLMQVHPDRSEGPVAA